MKKELGTPSRYTQILLDAIAGVDATAVVHKTYGPNIILRNDGQLLQEAIVLKPQIPELQISASSPAPWKALKIEETNNAVKEALFQMKKNLKASEKQNELRLDLDISMARKYTWAWNGGKASGIWVMDSPTLVCKRAIGRIYVPSNRNNPIQISLLYSDCDYYEIIKKSFTDFCPGEDLITQLISTEFTIDHNILSRVKILSPKMNGERLYLTTYIHFPLCMPYFDLYENYEMNRLVTDSNQVSPMWKIFRNPADRCDPSFTITNNPCYWGSLNQC